MNNMIWLMRAARWVRNPPSARQAAMVAAIVAAVMAIGMIEWMGWVPEWAQMDRPGHGGPRVPMP
ncbi:hypothetical protein [Paracoccus sp. (in: a-proteobacteria)]|uniref:hypothetical protein n=1 Tax=Paracoccus sp. TaxID=267 RepID=UPI0026E0D941|nr:hypothetical protein [Paracoccus sp. (in: a-proteobacteria)]MDO5369075.1 hypothetical protein [Paracoccus sp. (in: a-proteobacteria)]